MFLGDVCELMKDGGASQPKNVWEKAKVSAWFLTIGERNYKYEKGGGWNQPCIVGTGIGRQ